MKRHGTAPSGPARQPHNGVCWTYQWLLPNGQPMPERMADAAHRALTSPRPRRARKAIRR